MKEFEDEVTDALIYLLSKQTRMESYYVTDMSCTVVAEREIPDEEAQEIIDKLITVRGKK